MATTRAFDVIVVGGGIAGSVCAGVLARAGLGVLVIEREARFRDRVRGEGTYPWGVAEADRLGVKHLIYDAGGVDLVGVTRYKDRQVSKSYAWESDSLGGLPELGFSHPRLQEVAFQWAACQGATTLRPAKATAFAHNGKPSVTVMQDDRELAYTARLIVGADGRLSLTRRWTGGTSETDPEDHRMGGVQVAGVQTDDRATDNVSSDGAYAVNWFAQSAVTTRLYLLTRVDRLRQSGADRSFASLIALAARYMPEGSLDAAQQEGPIAFFPNNDVWATQVAGNGVALIGDAAGTPDPSVGNGTSLIFRDIRELTELLLSSRDWSAATAEYAARRQAYFDVIHANDCWRCILDFGEGPDAERMREGNERAKERDPSLGGFELLEARGPDGLVADEAARRHYFGEDLL
jgi:2-polyprenyl-6-methoxyphenol hydroxylase-like FAD-dependent oxidoreductase